MDELDDGGEGHRMSISSRKPSQDSTCQMVSSVTVTPMDSRFPDLMYWSQNLLSPVLFNQAVQRKNDDTEPINKSGRGARPTLGTRRAVPTDLRRKQLLSTHLVTEPTRAISC